MRMVADVRQVLAKEYARHSVEWAFRYCAATAEARGPRVAQACAVRKGSGAAAGEKTAGRLHAIAKSAGGSTRSAVTKALNEAGRCDGEARAEPDGDKNGGFAQDEERKLMEFGAVPAQPVLPKIGRPRGGRQRPLAPGAFGPGCQGTTGALGKNRHVECSANRAQNDADGKALANDPDIVELEGMRPFFTVSLKIPRGARVVDNMPQVRTWINQWEVIAGLSRLSSQDVEKVEPFDDCDIEFYPVTWNNVGTWMVPGWVHFPTVMDAVAFMGGEAAAHCLTMVERLFQLVDLAVEMAWQPQDDISILEAVAEVVGENEVAVLRLDDGEFGKIVEIVRWIAVNGTAGLRPHALPIRGVDSVLYRENRYLISNLSQGFSQNINPDIFAVEPRFTVHVLDERLWGDAPRDAVMSEFAARPEVLDGLRLRPDTVFIVEDPECAMSMGELAGSVAICGPMGRMQLLERVGWVRSARIIYWGSIDWLSFRSLSLMRLRMGQVESILMDSGTYWKFNDLAKPVQRRTEHDLPVLSDSERRALKTLERADKRKLSQQLIDWDYAWARIKQAAQMRGDD